jgi:drug/metabolite transporter (DMT)-like permease
MKNALFSTLGFCFFFALQIVLQKKFLTTQINPLQMNFFMSLSSFTLLTIYGMIFNKKIFSLKLERSTIKFFLLATFLWIAADISAIYGLKLSSSVNYSILSRTTVFFTYFIAVMFFNESFYVNKVISIFLTLIGSFLVVYNFKSSININTGDLLFLGFAVFNSFSGLFRQKIPKNLSAIHLTYLMFGLSTFTLGGLTFFLAPLKVFIIPQIIILISILGLFGFTLVNYSIQKGGASFFSVVSSLLPLFTAIFSFFILKSIPSMNQYIGGLIIIISIYIFQKKYASH